MPRIAWHLAKPLKTRGDESPGTARTPAGGPVAGLADAYLPPALPTPATAPARRSGVSYSAARWRPEGLADLAAELERGGTALRALPDADLLAAWSSAVEAFRDPASPERRALGPALAALTALSPAGLAAGLEAVLGGVRRGPAAALLERARGIAPFAPIAPAAPAAPALVVLAGNLPALAVQPLLPALALRRPVLLKSPSAEPLFAPAFLAALARREPRLAGAVAAATWPGGDPALEAPLLAAVGRVLAYGGAEMTADLAWRARGKVVAYGPQLSLGVVGREVAPAAVAAGLARDVALFDQRGCLSIVAVYQEGTADGAAALGRALAAALGELARAWPPGPAEPAALGAVQQARLTWEMRGIPRLGAELPLAAGTVVVEPEPALRPPAGLRTVVVHPLPDLARLPEILAPWRGRLQGAALAGAAAWALAPRLAALGISRLAAPGELQSPDAAWFNGGIDPLAALA